MSRPCPKLFTESINFSTEGSWTSISYHMDFIPALTFTVSLTVIPGYKYFGEAIDKPGWGRAFTFNK
jgi:hypothetical protein